MDVLCGTHKIKDGYLLKRCALTTVKLTEAPSLDEIQKFAPGGDEEDDDFDDEEDDEDGGARRKKSTNNHINRLAKLTMNEKKASKSAAARFLVGDQVIIVEGDLRNLEGVIKRVDADGRVIVDPSHKDLTDPLPFNPEQLRKHFKVGSTVRVVHGAHEGASGMVVKGFRPNRDCFFHVHERGVFRLHARSCRTMLKRRRASTASASTLYTIWPCWTTETSAF